MDFTSKALNFLLLIHLSIIIGPVFADSLKKERTFIMIKPDGVQRGLVGKIIQRFEEKGFKLISLKFLLAKEDTLRKHYAALKGKPFFESLIKYMTSGPLVPMVWEGLNVVKVGRAMLGVTNPSDCEPGTIRGDLCIQTGRNIIHGSDSVESANNEIKLWFSEGDLMNYEHHAEKWIYEKKK